MDTTSTIKTIEQKYYDMELPYFYSDPLDAGWMAKRYDMRFIIVRDSNTFMEVKFCNTDITIFGQRPKLTDTLIPSIHRENEKFYIHPDSLALLEQFSDEQKKAMKLLGLWPECESNRE
jgi:hypothetical protein